MSVAASLPIRVEVNRKHLERIDTMPQLRPLAVRIAVSATLVLAALPAAGWKWG